MRALLLLVAVAESAPVQNAPHNATALRQLQNGFQCECPSQSRPKPHGRSLMVVNVAGTTMEEMQNLLNPV
eukprot:COSAG04_NODE_27950_length_278_cov_2.268156_1_plen_70_part_10